MSATTLSEESATAEVATEKCRPAPTSAKLFLSEALGTFLLVLFGCGSVHTAVLLGAQAGLWQVAIVWGLAIMLAIYVVGA
ncbi:MAG: aquaporin, partial [Planctomycetales bacterium]|nr:aquaporin [Planctomycetales bacterium]